MDDHVRAEQRTRNEKLALREQIDRDSMFEDIVAHDVIVDGARSTNRNFHSVEEPAINIHVYGESRQEQW